MTPRSYPSAEAFTQVLEQRLRSHTRTGTAFARTRQLLVCDRFPARVVAVIGDAAMLTGGLVLEMRLARARTTRDIDLHMTGSPEHTLATLQDAGRIQLGDFMACEVGLRRPQPEIHPDEMQRDGLRFRAECRLAGTLYEHPFGVDVGCDDPVYGEPAVVVAEDLPAFAGLPPPRLRLYPVEVHIAKKLHAGTRPRRRPNSRVKDVPDLALPGTAHAVHAVRMRAALEQTFAFRATHSLPIQLPPPLETWRIPYAAMAREGELARTTLDDVTRAVRAFLDPVLSAGIAATWNPETWRWDHA